MNMIWNSIYSDHFVLMIFYNSCYVFEQFFFPGRLYQANPVLDRKHKLYVKLGIGVGHKNGGWLKHSVPAGTVSQYSNFYKHSVPAGTNFHGKWVTQRGRQEKADPKQVSFFFFYRHKTGPINLSGQLIT